MSAEQWAIAIVCGSLGGFLGNLAWTFWLKPLLVKKDDKKS